MSRFERKYSWRHVVLIVALFAAVGSVNLIPRETVVTSQCEGAGSAKESVKITSRGWPMTYAETREATKVCLVFNKGTLTQTANIKPTQEINVVALILNEVVLVAGATVLLVAFSKLYQLKAETVFSKKRKN